MIDLNIGLDGVPSLRKLNIGNKYENNDEMINFILPNEFDNYNKYIIAVIKQNGEKITKVIPVVDNIFYISSNITYIAGNWSMYLMCRENELDTEAEQVDISAKNGEHVFISDGFIGIVANSSIEKELVENAPIDTNLQLVYDDLLALKSEIIEKLNTPISYNNLVDVPKEFKPISHNHDDRYYTKEEVDNSINNEISNRTVQYNELKADVEQKISKEASDRTTQYNALNAKLEGKSNDGHKHVVNDITDFPTSMPANGGNSSTVNGHIVETNVPKGAVFTDTVYVHPETHPVSMITGLPTKVSQFENDKKYQTEEEVMGKISALIDSSPEFLDTLNEIANAIGNDPNFSVTIMKLISNKVEKEEGMGLSENSYTNAEKEKLNMLQNYDDTEIKFEINNLKKSIYIQNGILMIKNGGNN